jgi:hypothetical protein
MHVTYPTHLIRFNLLNDSQKKAAEFQVLIYADTVTAKLNL